ncbi:MAG: hypothetical protein EOO56_15420 [Hymenobacter sp.]|nr:MAG: hypothetical protein EOO56_15420 [Hymenobacter sp.]
MLLSLAGSLAQAQNTTWGFGLPITSNLANGTLTCSVTDPTQGVKTFGQNNVTLVRNVDGMVAWATATGYGFATYDVNLHNWQSIGANINTAITTLQTAYGVGAYATNSAYGYVRYNPALRQWATGGASTNSQGAISTNYGVVVWTNGGGAYGYATYDPAQAQWKSDGTAGAAGTTIVTQHGVVAWRTNNAYGAAIYNPVLHQWETQGSAGTMSEMVCDNGVAAWSSSTRYVVAAFSPTLRHWTSTGYAASVVANSLQITDGTVSFATSQGAQTLGYGVATDQWNSNTATTLYCALLPITIPQSPFVYFHNLSIGASSYSIACGDGQVIARRVGWKQYTSSSTYAPELTVSNASITSTCTGTVQVALATQAGQASSLLAPVPNPATGTVLVMLPVGTTQLQLLNLLGQAQWEALVPPTKTQYQVPLAGLAPGAYQLVVQGPAGPISTRLLVY